MTTLTISPNPTAEELQSITALLDAAEADGVDLGELEVKLKKAKANNKKRRKLNDGIIKEMRNKFKETNRKNEAIDALSDEQAEYAMDRQAINDAKARMYATITASLKSMHETLMSIIRNL